MSDGINVAVLGATGAVGQELLALLESRQFPVKNLTLLASPRSAGSKIKFLNQEITVEAVKDDSFQDIDIVLASAGGSTSKAYASKAVAAGAVVIDNSSAFRMDDDVPLVVPEINPEAAAQHQGIIANPNCTTILMGVAIHPLHKVQPIKRIVVSTYQSASGAGARAMAEVETQAQAILKGETPKPEILPYPLAFNLFPHNSPLGDNHYCQEEMKMVNETRKIFEAPEIRVTATCIRVPVLRAHSEAINLEFAHPFDVAKARELISAAPGVKLVEDWDKNYFPMPIDATGEDDVLVGRVRQDISHESSLELWLCGDQIRKGAALNAIQIAELLVEKDLLKLSQKMTTV
ncbi:Aspartate-semialdehyde dehydrogenase [Hyella patelloides LEGE 07179]|uniref:Aspartate-semialdehyde dehydrogenase n=1 Tax=Hyella patelloides LEGE 07179 TaxID=945734 RepID=A0A563VRJ7_9CYAN|nr:aspartate-semialdehyde dehydrogenase [Hyella patelloides]VEP14044.1 Aspartate-semialdehyde dehydrogenase [Hyella patelloides LEGE 07179]